MATSPTAVIVANNVHEHFTVGTLPVALRLILSLEKSGVSRIILCADPTGSSELKKMLVGSKRLPASVEWYEVHDGHSLSNLVASIVAEGTHDKLFVARGDTTYSPAVVRELAAWDGESGGLALQSGEQFAGICALSAVTAKIVAGNPLCAFNTVDHMHHILASMQAVENKPVPQTDDSTFRTRDEQLSPKKPRLLVNPLTDSLPDESAELNTY